MDNSLENFENCNQSSTSLQPNSDSNKRSLILRNSIEDHFKYS